MSILEAVRMAVRNIRGSKVRTLLTMLGIIIGITAVIVIVGLGNGLQGYMEDTFAEMGTDTLTVNIMGRGSSRSVSEERMYEIQKENADLLSDVSPTVTVRAAAKIGTETLSSSISGVSEAYLAMKKLTVIQGRGFEFVDVDARRDVCVVGAYISQAYFAGNAVGETVKLNGRKFTVVGVLDQQSDTLEEGGADDCLYLPYSTAARLSGTGTLSSWLYTLTSEDYAAEAKTVLEDALYDVFEDEDAYTVVSMSELLDSMNSMIGVLIAILAAIAAISLVVGGIGIMNIMLVSVTERTREIGIRKALGAKEAYIMEQFVIEAALTSALGGVLGIVFGYLLSSAATVIATAMLEVDITVAPSAAAVAIAFGISVGIGILFGYLPAQKAARLNPIDALRSD